MQVTSRKDTIVQNNLPPPSSTWDATDWTIAESHRSDGGSAGCVGDALSQCSSVGAGTRPDIRTGQLGGIIQVQISGVARRSACTVDETLHDGEPAFAGCARRHAEWQGNVGLNLNQFLRYHWEAARRATRVLRHEGRDLCEHQQECIRRIAAEAEGKGQH